jgi:hypothetical protein
MIELLKESASSSVSAPTSIFSRFLPDKELKPPQLPEIEVDPTIGAISLVLCALLIAWVGYQASKTLD